MDVSCGQNHTIAHGKHGKIYSWGENKHGQLGIIIDEGNKKIDAHEVKIVEGRGEILELRTGWTHTCVLRDDGNVYAWGRNTYGQLGRREEEERQCWKSKGVEFGMRIRQLAVGSEHNIALSGNYASSIFIFILNLNFEFEIFNSKFQFLFELSI